MGCFFWCLKSITARVVLFTGAEKIPQGAPLGSKSSPILPYGFSVLVLVTVIVTLHTDTVNLCSSLPYNENVFVRSATSVMKDP